MTKAELASVRAKVRKLRDRLRQQLLAGVAALDHILMEFSVDELRRADPMLADYHKFRAMPEVAEAIAKWKKQERRRRSRSAR